MNNNDIPHDIMDARNFVDHLPDGVDFRLTLVGSTESPPFWTAELEASGRRSAMSNPHYFWLDAVNECLERWKSYSRSGKWPT